MPPAKRKANRTGRFLATTTLLQLEAVFDAVCVTARNCIHVLLRNAVMLLLLREELVPRHMQGGETPSPNDDDPLLQLELISTPCVLRCNLRTFAAAEKRCDVAPAKLDAELPFPPAA